MGAGGDQAGRAGAVRSALSLSAAAMALAVVSGTAALDRGHHRSAAAPASPAPSSLLASLLAASSGTPPSGPPAPVPDVPTQPAGVQAALSPALADQAMGSARRAAPGPRETPPAAGEKARPSPAQGKSIQNKSIQNKPVQDKPVPGKDKSIPGPANTAAGGRGAPSREPLRIADAALEPMGWSDLEGWAGDDHAAALATFQASCRPIVRSRADPRDARPVRAALAAVCVRAVRAGSLGPTAARRFFEDNFTPLRIRKLGESTGFLTGYYEPIVEGSRFPTRDFTVPLYRRPPDLIAAGATEPGGPFPNSGRAFRRHSDGQLVPYYDRGDIEDGALDGQHLEICWLRSATDALFIQIQGSARVRLEDGTMLRVNYDAHNGYPYVPVGRVLTERNALRREDLSMQRIREWMQAHPDEAREVRRQNRSMVFFRVVGLTEDDEAVGAQGIPLSAGRSIAVDKALHVYGTPFFIAANLPIAGAQPNTPFRRIMIAQDTGSAIVGPARADLYFGAGDEAGLIAGRVRQPGQFAMLVPKDLDPVVAGAHMPVPRERPSFAPPEAATASRGSASRSAAHVERGPAARRLLR